MANKQKKTTGKKPKTDPKKADAKPFKQEKEEKIDWKKLARDERTWKITGAVFLLIAIFLCIAFISYFFYMERRPGQGLSGSFLAIDGQRGQGIQPFRKAWSGGVAFLHI